MAFIIGAAAALLLPFLTLLVVFALSDNASDHAFRVLQPVKSLPPRYWDFRSDRAA